ncbi:MAG: pseudouridine-5'-phosphate glycosidase [Caldisericaceae bacterium]|nr:pseudouridine-5'-phosphate glycosidase [Caldisericaceae bacterium]
MKINNEILDAINTGRPIVALESTIIAQGMPYPKNIQIALAVEEEVRKIGAVPATIGIINGKIIIGMTQEEIHHLGHTKDVLKLSTREIPFCIAEKKDGATTVSATSYIAELVGIRVFATGGIGGVHRNAEHTFDISRDLDELAVRNIIVVSAGAKSILDLEKTLEYLETRGVLVVGFKTNEFPAFYTRKSELTIPQANSAKEIANIYNTKISLGIFSSILVANPIQEEYEIPKDKVDRWIDIAGSESQERGIKGKKVTPFLLSRIVELSKGEALDANCELVKNNARVAAEIAKALHDN